MICVVLPVYNKANTLANSVDSVLRQSDGDFELIVVDDGSTDGIDAALSPYCGEPRLRVLRQPNGGVSAARNRGIRAARGDIVCFLDADDEWLPGHLAAIRRMADAHPQAAFFMTGCRIELPGGGSTDNARFLPDGENGRLIEDYFAYTEQIGGEMILYTISVGVRTDALRRAGGFQEGVRIGEDYDLWLRILLRERAVFTSQVTSVYHRELSTATAAAGGNMDVNWYFQTREAALLSDDTIPSDRREHLRAFMDRFRIRKARHLLMAGRRAEARAALAAVRATPGNRRAMLVTRLCLLLPPALVRRAYERKKRGA